ncbi:hypothetical protein TVD_04430 [Thioalkalivibrio versutus]|uniref:Uncharacterized protein n=1 Tax=Thioalkalivibrio versutus TaxID=106634 RepID=A0A0G3G0F4_9GAMM|nr:hypothetical protein [Thioalkalivibrio versutus]AKJ94663.1 hypothetical protein TVD_04430 [Thioalkalivibrio versutus]
MRIMKHTKWIVATLVGITVVALTASWVSRSAHGISIEHCADLHHVDNRHIPPGLFMSAVKCVQQGRLEPAIEMFALAGIYGSFDAKRVRDKTAHSAIPATIMGTFAVLNPDESARFDHAFQETTNDPQRMASLCASIDQIGPPAYYPHYMTSHGMSAFTGGDAGPALVEGFDPSDTWNMLLDRHLHCPKED